MAQESEDLKKQHEYRMRLMDKINELHSADNLNTILSQIKDSIAELFSAERLTIYVADAKRNLLISKVKSGVELQQIVIPISDASLAGYCAISGAVLHIKNAYDANELYKIGSNLKFDDSWDKKTGFVTKQVLCVPMKFQKTLIGVLQIINKKDGSLFNEIDIGYATELAASLSVAIHNIYRLSATTKVIRQMPRYNFLLDKNLVDDKIIEKAVNHPDDAKIGLDTVLMRDFGVAREDMAKNLSFYFGTEFIGFDPAAQPLDDELLKRVKPNQLVKEGWVPFKIENDILHIVMEDPSDLGRHDTIKFVYPEYKRISYIGAFREDIRNYINLFYRYGASVTVSGSINDLLNKLYSSDVPEIENESKKVSEQDSVIVQLVNKIIMDAVQKRYPTFISSRTPERKTSRYACVSTAAASCTRESPTGTNTRSPRASRSCAALTYQNVESPRTARSISKNSDHSILNCVLRQSPPPDRWSMWSCACWRRVKQRSPT